MRERVNFFTLNAKNTIHDPISNPNCSWGFQCSTHVQTGFKKFRDALAAAETLLGKIDLVPIKKNEFGNHRYGFYGHDFTPEEWLARKCQ